MKCLNRTIMELKFQCPLLHDVTSYSLNRTIMELKYERAQERQ